jgi:hypothetical protein
MDMGLHGVCVMLVNAWFLTWLPLIDQAPTAHV